MPNTLTRPALNSREERAAAKIGAYGPVARRGALSVTVKFAATASRPVPIGATTATTRRAIALIRAAKAVLPLVDTTGTWLVALDPTQREFVLRNRGPRSRVPLASHPPYPGRGQTNIAGPSRRIHMDRRGNSIDAQIGR